MKALITYLAISLLASFVFVIVPIIRRAKAAAIWSTFLQLFFTGLIIFYLNLPVLQWWTAGIAIGGCLSLPVVIRLYKKEKGVAFLLLSCGVLYGLLIALIKVQLPTLAGYIAATA